MEEIKVAIGLTNLLSTLYKLDVLAIHFHGLHGPYVQITREKFLKLWPDAVADDDNRYRTFIDGVEVMAVA